MAKWHVGLSVVLKQIFVAATAATLPGTHPKIGEIDHDVVGDSIGAINSHVLFQHVQELVYHRSDTEQATAAFFPENITDLQKYAIVSHTPIKVTGLTAAGNVAVSMALGTDLTVALTVAPANAYNQKLSVSTSNAEVATAWLDPKAVDGANKLTIRAHDKGECTVVVQSSDGYKTVKRTVTVY